MIVAQPDSPSTPTEGRAAAAQAFRLVTTFNLLPALYWHGSWRRTYERLAGAMCAEPLWVRALSNAALREQHLHEHFDFDFEPAVKRIVLFDVAALDRVCRLLAALCLRDRLQRVVSRAEVTGLRDCIGADIHRLALEWSDAVPAYPRETLPTLNEKPWPAPDQWLRLGCAVLCAALPVSRAALGRLRFKFPRGWPRELFDTPGRADAMHGALVLRAAQLAAPGSSWLLTAEPVSAHAPRNLAA